jgi:hypothetical protein
MITVRGLWQIGIPFGPRLRCSRCLSHWCRRRAPRRCSLANACAGASGILIGLGFKLKGDSSYTDLDGGSPGPVVYEGNNIRFVGGHLDGQVGRSVSSTGFNIRSISCSHN